MNPPTPTDPAIAAAHRGSDGRVVPYTIPTDPMVYAAYALACRAHIGQYRRCGVRPYMVHVDAVMTRAPKDPISQCVAALHDTVESDCAHPLTISAIVAGLSQFVGAAEVGDGVDALTRRGAETYAAFIERICLHRGGVWRAHKAADCLANLSDTPTSSQTRRYATALLALVPREDRADSLSTTAPDLLP